MWTIVIAAAAAAACIAAALRLQPQAQPSPASPAVAATGPAFAATRAFNDLFATQADAPEADTGPGEHTRLWHQQALLLAGTPAQAVFTETRFDQPPGAASSISAATYRLVDGQWKLAGASRDFARAGASGAPVARPRGPLQVLQFPSGTVAFLIDQQDRAHGYTQSGEAIWAFAKGEWRDLGFVQTGGDNAGAAVAAAERYRFTGTVSMAPGSRTWPDLQVARSGTIRDEHDRVVPVTDTRYVFTGKSYEEVLARR